MGLSLFFYGDIMITLEQIKNNKEVQIFLDTADKNFTAIGYKEHGFRHAEISALVSGKVLKALDYPEEDVELAKISGYLHDIGNALGQEEHHRTSAILAMRFLQKMDVPNHETFKVMGAIGSHEDRDVDPASPVSAAVIIGDKSDVHRSRIRKTDLTTFDTHDRVNYAATETDVKIDPIAKVISLYITIDAKFCSVMEYFEIFISRMKFCKRAANFLGCRFALFINGDKML
jgi:hypothetical protein